MERKIGFEALRADVQRQIAGNLRAMVGLKPERPARPARPVTPGSGTRVTMKAFDIFGAPRLLDVLSPDHQYVEYDDGREQYIARGGPKAGPSWAAGWPVAVTANVRPAAQSADYRRGERVLDQHFLPGVRAADASQAARTIAAGVQQAQNPYGLFSNSNSYAADTYEATSGRRVGDVQTVGARTQLRREPPPPPPRLLQNVLNPRLF